MLQIKAQISWFGPSFADGKRSKTAARSRRISCAQRRETADSAVVRFYPAYQNPAKAFIISALEAISKKAFEAISSVLVKTEAVRAFQAGGLKKRANERFRQKTQGN